MMATNRIPITTKDPEQLAELVQLIDPELKFVRDLYSPGNYCRSLLVDQNGTERVLKVRENSSNIWDDTYFYYEIHALRRVEERNLKNVSRLIQQYSTDTHHAILKTYSAGTALNHLDHETLLKDQDFIRKLDELYLQLHLAGIAKIQFMPRKFVVDADDELILVDLATCIVNTEAGVSYFAKEMREDSRFITNLEKRARAA